MNKIKEFIGECQLELKKVVWPEKHEMWSATRVVLFSVILLTAFLYVIDFMFTKVANLVLY